jgi:hypothetical protein
LPHLILSARFAFPRRRKEPYAYTDTHFTLTLTLALSFTHTPILTLCLTSEIRFHGDAKNPTPDATDTQHIQVTGSVNPDEVIYGEKTGEGKEEL